MLTNVESLKRLDLFRSRLDELYHELQIKGEPRGIFKIDTSRLELIDQFVILRRQFLFLKVSADDHLFATLVLFKDAQTNLAPMTCVRSVVEACAIADWLINPKIDCNERVSRGYRQRLYELEEYGKTIESIGTELGQNLKAINKTKTEVVNECQSFHARARISPQTKRPSIINLTEAFGLKEEYRILCGYSHSTSLIGRHSFTFDGNNLDNGYQNATIDLKPEMVNFAYWTIVRAYGQMSLNAFEYFGGKSTEITSLLDEIYDPTNDFLWNKKFW